MTIEGLQKKLDEKNIPVKILYVENCTDIGNYWIVYTDDLSYVPEEPFPREYLVKPEEKDVLAGNYEEAIEYFCYPTESEEK